MFGHSHMWAIHSALKGRSYVSPEGDLRIQVLLCGTAEFPSDLTLLTHGGREHINPALVGALAPYHATRQGCWLASYVQGSYASRVLQLEIGERIEFVHPRRPDLPLRSGARLVPYDAIRRLMEAEAKQLQPFLGRLAKLGYAGVLHLEGPPPISSNEHVRSALERAGSSPPPEAEVAPASLRLKLWSTQQDVVRAVCARTGAKYVPPPPDAVDEHGYMKQELWKDSIHGNHSYGAQVITQVQALVRSAARTEKGRVAP